MEPISITAMVVSIITAIGVLLSRIKFRHCLCGCIESDCVNTPPPTPEPSIEPSIYIQPSPVPHRREINV
jgi:hypothetical protein